MLKLIILASLLVAIPRASWGQGNGRMDQETYDSYIYVLVEARYHCFVKKGYDPQELSYQSEQLQGNLSTNIWNEPYLKERLPSFIDAMSPHLDSDCWIDIQKDPNRFYRSLAPFAKAINASTQVLKQQNEVLYQQNDKMRQELRARREKRIQLLSAPPCTGRANAVAIVEKEEFIDSVLKLSRFIDINAFADSRIENSIFARFGCRPFLPPISPVF